MIDLNFSEQTAALVAGLLGAVFGLQKVISMWKRGSVDQSKIEAEQSVINSLHDEFKRVSKEMEESRKLQKEMNDMIHQQAIKLTRMEMLMIRMYNLLSHNNIAIPDDLRSDMVDLLGQPNAGAPLPVIEQPDEPAI
jgi:uncharacterized membrane protein (DUF106 family)